MICRVKSISGTGFFSTTALCNAPSILVIECAPGAKRAVDSRTVSNANLENSKGLRQGDDSEGQQNGQWQC